MSPRDYIEARSIPIPFVGCWLWLKSFGSHGYGNAKLPGSVATVAHRVSYEAFEGPIPSGRLVQHSCDNHWCVNPDHLSIGTDKSNAIDKQIKGRAARKLTPDDVVDIRALVHSGHSYNSVARAFGIHSSLVARIDRREIWNHV